MAGAVRGQRNFRSPYYQVWAARLLCAVPSADHRRVRAQKIGFQGREVAFSSLQQLLDADYTGRPPSA